MLKKFFDTTVVDQVAERIVAELGRTFPARRVDDETKQTTLRSQIIDQIRRQGEKLVATQRLNIYQKAKFGTKLQERLQAIGYPAAFSKTIAHDAVTLIALAASKPR